MSHDELHLDGQGDDDPTGALLRGVLQRQADAVRPSGDGLARIQAGIARQQPHLVLRPRGRRFTPLLAAAAALVVVAAGGTAAVRVLVHKPTAADQGSIILRTAAQAEVRATPASALPVYVAARQRGRVVLFREFDTVKGLSGAEAQVAEAVRLALTQRPQDPDDAQLFAASPAPKVTATISQQRISLDISPAPAPRDPAITADEAQAAADQLVWTATAAAYTATQAAGAAPAVTPSVHITLGGRAGQSLFGLVPLTADLRREIGPKDPRAGAWIIGLAEGARRRPGPLDVVGDAVAVDDARVLVVLRRDGRIIRSEFVPLTASEASAGSQPPRPGQRGAWRITGWDASPAGTYSLEVYAPPRLPVPPAARPSPTASPASATAGLTTATSPASQTTQPGPASQTPTPRAEAAASPAAEDPWSDSKTFVVR